MSFFSMIPDPIAKLVIDTLVEFLSDQAQKYAGESVAGKIRSFSNQATFKNSVKQAINKGVLRFKTEYLSTDEDLVEAISRDPKIWQSPSFTKALTHLICKPGSWQVDQQEIIEDHFQDVLPERINRARVDKAISFLLRCIIEELWTLPGTKEVRELYLLQFQKISAETAREQVALLKQQLEATTLLTQEIRQAYTELVSGIERKMITAGDESTLSNTRPRPYHNLPRPDYKSFVGREKELAWLYQRLSVEDRAWQIAITGIGGVGKTALALAVGHYFIKNYSQLPEKDRFEAIVWISAKEEVLTAYGKEKAALDDVIFHTLEDVYSAIADVFRRDDIYTADGREKRLIIESVLKEQRTLLILDNLESVKDERIKPFLRNLPSPTKAIITSREWLEVADIYTMSGLPENEANEFIQTEAVGQSLSLTDLQKKRIYDLTSGLPLPIKLGIARLSFGESFDSVARWLGDAVGDLPEYCILGQMQLACQRDANAWKVLFSCALFDRTHGASNEALGSIADLSLKDRDDSISNLQRLFLINRYANDRYWTLPIVQRQTAASFGEDSTSKDLIDRWLNWLIDFSKQHGGDFRYRLEDRGLFDLEFANILTAIRWCKEQKRWNELFQLAENSWGYTYSFGLHDEWLEIISAASQSAKEVRNEQYRSQVELQECRFTWIRGGNLAELKNKLIEVEKLAVKNGNYNDHCEALLLHSKLLRNTGQLDDSKQLAIKVINLAEQNHERAAKYYLLSGFNILALIEIENKDFPEASQWIDAVSKAATDLGSYRGFTGAMFLRAYSLICQENYSEAEKFVSQVMSRNLLIGDLRHVAEDKRSLAEIYLKMNRAEHAYKMAGEALDLFTKLGMKRHMQLVEKLIAEIMTALK